MAQSPGASNHVGLVLTGVGVIVGVVGLLQIEQVRNFACEWSGAFCQRTTPEIRLFTVDYSSSLPNVVQALSPKGAWARFVDAAGATTSDPNCVTGNAEDLRSRGVAQISGAPEIYRSGSEQWTMSSLVDLSRQTDRSLMVDLAIKYPSSFVDKRLTVTVQAYYGDYRIAPMDRTYHILLPSHTDYTEVSCGLEEPSAPNLGKYKYDFTIADDFGGRDPLIEKEINVVR